MLGSVVFETRQIISSATVHQCSHLDRLAASSSWKLRRDQRKASNCSLTFRKMMHSCNWLLCHTPKDACGSYLTLSLQNASCPSLWKIARVQKVLLLTRNFMTANSSIQFGVVVLLASYQWTKKEQSNQHTAALTLAGSFACIPCQSSTGSGFQGESYIHSKLGNGFLIAKECS